jgi:4a-hydroxytetrahydrobiopterin dehydratase
MVQDKLGAERLSAWLEKSTGWAVAAGKLHRDYSFADFKTAFGFMTIAAIAIEKLDHHPEWANVYNKVSVDLTTHDAGGITQKDLELAEILDKAAGKLL